MTASRWTFSRLVDETYAEILVVTLPADQIALYDYASAEAAATALEAANIRLMVPAISASLAAAVSAEVVDGDVALTLSWSPTEAMTGSIQRHACHVVHEPGSPIAERVICEGSWVVLTRSADP